VDNEFHGEGILFNENPRGDVSIDIYDLDTILEYFFNINIKKRMD
jgi:hypothetical protein